MLLHFPFAPIARNHSHVISGRGKFSRLVKTSKCREFEDRMMGWLLRYEKDKREFLGQYKADIHGIDLKMQFRTPKLFTKKGLINKRSVDCDAFKVSQDVLMDWVGIDDSQVLTLSVHKTYAKGFGFSYELDLVNYKQGYNILNASGDI